MPTDSVLDAQAELVRSQVLEGVAQLLSEGEELTFASVATAAGVSERTVYRHFANRDALMAAVYSWTNERIGFRHPRTAPARTGLRRQPHCRDRGASLRIVLMGCSPESSGCAANSEARTSPTRFAVQAGRVREFRARIL
jgi:AcrR family transcriptional regulator